MLHFSTSRLEENEAKFVMQQANEIFDSFVPVPGSFADVYLKEGIETGEKNAKSDMVISLTKAGVDLSIIKSTTGFTDARV